MGCASPVQHGKEIFAEEINEVVEPIERAKNGDLLSLITVEQELSQDRNDL